MKSFSRFLIFSSRHAHRLVCNFCFTVMDFCSKWFLHKKVVKEIQITEILQRQYKLIKCIAVRYLWKQKFAFSLIEMLMALLVASLLLAALAPVMTRKFTENISVSGTGEAIIPKTFCGYVNDTFVAQLYDDENKGCKVPQNTYTASAIIASGGGGGGGAAGSVTGTMKTGADFSGSAASSSTKTYVITKYVTDLYVELLGGGGGGGKGATNQGGYPASQTDCGGAANSASSWGIYIKPEYNGVNGHGTCVSKYNPGEGKSGSMGYDYNVMTRVGAFQTCNLASNGGCCWIGEDRNGCSSSSSSYYTAGSFNSSNGTYSGGCRTVCQWNAANAVCNTYVYNDFSGRLPTAEEVQGWSNNFAHVSKGLGVNGLQLCSYRQVAGSSYCSASLAASGACAGAAGSQCFPYMLWTSAPDGNDSHIAAGLHSNNPGVENELTVGHSRSNKYAHSVRCVIDKVSSYAAYYGAGGNGGMYARIKIPDEIIAEATKNGNAILKLTAGQAGAGASSTANATSGGFSRAEILDSSNNILWAYQLPGGNAGGNGTNGADGEGGKNGTAGSAIGVSSTVCKYKNILDVNYKTEQNIACNKNGLEISNIYAGGSGTSGGLGGSSYFNSSNASGGSSGTNVAPNGITAGNSGAGGGGGYAAEGTTRLNANIGAGGNGGPGRVKYTYKIKYPGVGGGGAGAGTVLHVVNFTVRPNQLIKVKVGERGHGGTPDSNGTGGGNSYVELPSGIKYEVTGGGFGYSGIAGVPDANTLPKAGAGGNASGITNTVKGILGTNDRLYPEESSETKGNAATEYADNFVQASGGNGGINSKTSAIAGSGGIPCGGFSNMPVKINETVFNCNVNSYSPLALTRTLAASNFNTDVITNFAAGSTGGGGGGWSADNGASGGADGMGGYVFIYFGEW